MELGGSPSAIMEKASIPTATLGDPDALVSLADLAALLHEAAAATKCDHVGLLLGERASLQHLGLLGLLLRSSPTFRTAIAGLIEYLAIHTSGIQRELHSERGVAHIASVFEDQEISRSTQEVQMSVAMTWKLCQHLLHNLWQPSSVYFTFAEPKDKVFFRHFFKVPVIFNAEFNGVVFHAADLELQLPEHDSFLHEEITRQISKVKDEISYDFVAEVRRLIRKNLEIRICSIDSVVRFFPFEKRTFQRKLKLLGASYQDVLNEVRFQKAEFYLQRSDLTISQLAELLCFKSVSVFSIAFKKQYAVSPSVWREERR